MKLHLAPHKLSNTSQEEGLDFVKPVATINVDIVGSWKPQICGIFTLLCNRVAVAWEVEQVAN